MEINMSRIAVITDSNSGINFEDAKELGIKVLPMPFLIDGKTYFEEISLSQEEFFEKLENDVDISTSQPSPESVMKIWDEALEEADEVVYIPMSSGLSSSCHTALMLADDYDGKVQVVDNQRISVTQRQSVLDAMELAKRGLTAVQIKEKLEKVKFESSIYIMLDTLKYLKKGGRITPAAAAFGSALRLKPVLTIQGEKLDAYAIAKTKKQDAKVKLTSISVAGTMVYPPADGKTPCAVTNLHTIRLHEKDHGFSIEFSTLNYGNCNRVKYAYRLKNYENEWTETLPGEHTARYNFVPSGKYVFQVRATDEKGHWSDKITEVKVTITPYFYKSWWFYLLLAILITVGSYYFYQWKISLYRQQKKQLEKEVAQRTHELELQNKQLEIMARHVEEVTEEKIAFFTNITHEFRTPVTLINGPIQRALDESHEPEVKKQLQIAERNSNYLLSLVNELMDFRKLDADKVVLNKTNENFIRLIQNILMPFEVFAHERNINIITYFRLCTPFWIFDVEYMRKAIINLISNAVKFTPDYGKISLYVASLTDKDNHTWLFIDIKDTGNGIVPEDIERIFERFYQSKKSIKYPVYGQSSTGIGLFLCKKIISLHGGNIYAGNNPKQGAFFRILLPLEKGIPQAKSEKEKYEQNEHPLSIPANGNEKKETILIVEDNADMRTYICSILKNNYQLKEAQNGAEALYLIQRETIDLIVSDLMMPVMDGNELSRRVKANLATSHIPFLMLTALRSEAQERISYEIGVDEYLCKPFDEVILRLRIRNILALRQKYKSMFSTSMNCETLNINASSKDNTFMTSAINLMKEHYADSDYNLERFIRDMGYSKTLVNQKLQSLTGQSIGQFMRNYRLNVAKDTLTKVECDISVAEIAYAVGFNDPKYFTKCFKELFGVLPSEYFGKK